MEFLLERDVVFLNHGSFGACPRVVHEQYQHWQKRLESQPVRFMQRELPQLMSESRAKLASYLGADADEVVFVTNPTYAVNEIARSLRLAGNDQVLTSDQEYGACMNAWLFMSQKLGFEVVQRDISLPVDSHTSLVEEFWSGVTAATKVIFLSHITSPTALTIPVTEICRRAKARGILTVIDGAHTAGQVDVDLHSIGADFYVGTCHKWLCAPKGSSYFYARRDVQHLIEPLVVGWGWGSVHRHYDSGSSFLDYHEWIGTDDPASYLTIPAAIQFQSDHDWPSVRTRCHALAVELVDRASRLDSVQAVHAEAFYHQMALIQLTVDADPVALKTALYDRHRVEVPVFHWKNRLFVRASLQAYNSTEDVDCFVHALQSVLT